MSDSIIIRDVVAHKAECNRALGNCQELWIEDLPGRIELISSQDECASVYLEGSAELIEQVGVVRHLKWDELCYRNQTPYVYDQKNKKFRPVIPDGVLTTKICLPADIRVKYKGAPEADLTVRACSLNLDLYLEYSGRASVDFAQTLIASVSGDAQIAVQKLGGGYCCLMAYDDGRIFLDAGECGRLVIIATQNGYVGASVAAVEAMLIANNDANIKVLQPVERLRESRNDNGRIEIC